MIGPFIALVLFASPQDASGVEQAPAAAVQADAIEPGMMRCVNQGRRNRTCTTSEGERLRCQKQRQLGSHFENWVCLTYREDQTIQRDSQDALDRQQHITTPGGG